MIKDEAADNGLLRTVSTVTHSIQNIPSSEVEQTTPSILYTLAISF